MRVDSFDVSDDKPEPECDHMAWHDGRAGEGGEAKEEHLRPVRVRSGEAYGRRVLVVDMVDLVVSPLCVQKPVDPVAKVVLHQEVDH